MSEEHRLSVRLRAIEMDEIITTPSLLKMARGMTLHGGSGMNQALDYYTDLFNREGRSIDALGIFAYSLDQPVGWSLFTYESDNFSFMPRPGRACAQVFVKPPYRRLGVGTELITMASKLARPDVLEVYMWSAQEFFQPLAQKCSHIRDIE